MSPRKTGLAAFTGSQASERRGHESASEAIRTKAKGDTVSVSLRLTPDQWERVHQLARAEGVSLNRLAIIALSKMFQEKGLPGL
jgi:predicted HicB family RNase H-like nuclease